MDVPQLFDDVKQKYGFPFALKKEQEEIIAHYLCKQECFCSSADWIRQKCNFSHSTIDIRRGINYYGLQNTPSKLIRPTLAGHL